MLETSRPFLAGQAASVGIDAKLQSFPVDVVGETLDAVWETLGIGDNRSIRLTAYLPAVVNVDVLIAGGLHPAGDHGVSDFSNEFFTHVTTKLVPTVPTHRRSRSERCLRRAASYLSGGQPAHEKHQAQGQLQGWMTEAVCHVYLRSRYVHAHCTAGTRLRLSACQLILLE